MGGSIAGTSVVLGVGMSGTVAASEDDDLKIEKKTKHPKRQVANKPGRDVVLVELIALQSVGNRLTGNLPLPFRCRCFAFVLLVLRWY